MASPTSDPTRPDAVIARGPDLTERLDHLVRDELLHRTVYTDPELFDLEMQRIFGGSWVFLAHDSEIPAPGDFVRRQMGKRQILIVRTEQGEVKGLLNRCTHRGTTLVPGDAGCAKRFVCPYHGWAFDLDGASPICRCPTVMTNSMNGPLIWGRWPSVVAPGSSSVLWRPIRCPLTTGWARQATGWICMWRAIRGAS